MVKSQSTISCILLSLFLFFSLLFVNEIYAKDVETNGIIQVSIDDLIAKPEKYHKKRIRLSGYMIIEFEHQALYPTEVDANNRLYEKGIWLYFGDAKKDIKMKKRYTNNFVIVTGIFDKDMHGHGYLFSGGIIQIKSLEKRSE